ncbi:MAG: hypothetical protein AB7V56_10125 [Candidatus Nitrosocosmicus sp.]|jgi:hypothetical protein|nr:hypothetical protein [Candidatus Nitrosocosmicus sp.]
MMPIANFGFDILLFDDTSYRKACANLWDLIKALKAQKGFQGVKLSEKDEHNIQDALSSYTDACKDIYCPAPIVKDSPFKPSGIASDNLRYSTCPKSTTYTKKHPQ